MRCFVSCLWFSAEHHKPSGWGIPAYPSQHLCSQCQCHANADHSTHRWAVYLSLLPILFLKNSLYFFYAYFEGFLTFVVHWFGNSKIRFGLQMLCAFIRAKGIWRVCSSVDGAQVCKTEQRPSSLPVGPVVTVMGSLQTPTPNSTGTKIHILKL